MKPSLPNVIHLGPCSLQIPAQLGGAVERRIWEVARVQARNGAAVQVFSIGDEDGDEVIDEVLVSRVRLTGKSYLRPLQFLRKCAARIASDDAILHLHNMPEGAFVFRKRPNVRVLSLDYPRFRRGRRTPLFFFYRWCLTHFDLLLPVSHFCQLAAARYWLLPENDFHVVHNGVNLQQFHFDTSWRVKFRETYALGDAPLLAYAGRINYQKGTDLLLDSYAALKTRFPTLRLAICGPAGQFGSGQQTNLTARIAKDGGLYLGEASEHLLTALMSAADLFVLPTRCDEMFGMVAAEAQACELPIVVSDNGGLPEVVTERSGRFFPAGDGAALTATITSLLERPEELQACRDNARVNARRFAWEKICDDLTDAYRLAGLRRGSNLKVAQQEAK